MRKGRNGGETGEKNGGKKEKTNDYSGHYVISSSQLPKRRPLERRTLVPKCFTRSFFPFHKTFFLVNTCSIPSECCLNHFVCLEIFQESCSVIPLNYISFLLIKSLSAL